MKKETRDHCLSMNLTRPMNYFWKMRKCSYIGNRKTGNSKSLTPFIDEKRLIRVRERLDKAEFLTHDLSHSVLLPAHHPVSTLMIRDNHEQGHCGAAATVAKCCRNVWVCKGHALAKVIVQNCVLCRELAHKAHTTIMASLQSQRPLQFAPTLCHTAIDYCDPFTVKSSRNKTDKHYGVIFKCMNCWAVHLKLAQNASSDESIQVRRRFLQ